MSYIGKSDIGKLKFALRQPTEDELDEMDYLDRPPRFDSDYSPLQLPIFWLPHSCDEWVIGGISEARRLVEDLMEAIRIAETHDTGRSSEDRELAGAKVSTEAETGAEGIASEGSAGA